ncbi:MAG: histidinol-phosphate transaminase [Candidatus Acidiferrales bacterium]
MSKSIGDEIPAFIREISPYVPGKPVEEVERELGMRAIKLASNENPLGPSPKAIESAKKALGESNRYPDGGGHYLREALSERLEIPMKNLILGGGSTDLIDLVARVLLQKGTEGIASEGSFPLYYISIRATGAKLVEVPQRDFVMDLDAIARAVTPRTKIIYLANPNNPTGTIFTSRKFETFLEKLPERVLVVLDEAYFDYVQRQDYSRSLELVRGGKNLLVLRTFSKVYGLAGLRIGFGAGPEELLHEINKIRAPFNTSHVAQAAAVAALDDAEHVRRSLEMNRAGLEQLAKGLSALGVKFIPSFANFILVDMGGEAQSAADALLRLGVIVRPMAWMGFPNAIRVTVGTRHENDQFLQALAQVRAPAGKDAR